MNAREVEERTVNVAGDLVLSEETQAVLRSRPLSILEEVLEVLCV